MKTDTTNDVWVDVSLLPHKGKLINWEASIGHQVPFKYYEIEGKINILSYEGKYLLIQFLDNTPYYIKSCRLANGELKTFLKQSINWTLIKWKYDVGDHIIDKNRNLTITNVKKINNKKMYQYKCNQCSFDCGEHYIGGEFFKEYWTEERHLTNGHGCICCSNKATVPGINDIPTTDPWMISYFQGGKEEAKKYSRSSGKKIFPICPDCNNIQSKQVVINRIYNYHSIGCTCSDNISYPNKFSYAFLRQLPIYNWIPEYQPDWLKPYFYDNYFEYNDKKYVLEMDGGIGHGNIEYGTNKKDICGKERDDYKDYLAIKHNIEVIRIDCTKSDITYIKENILKSNLNNIFDLQNINWLECDAYALKNFIKEICVFWEENNHPNYNIIKSKFNNICDLTIQRYLEKGTKQGWCNYYKGIYYDDRKKRVNVYDKYSNYIETFPSTKELAEQSYVLFGVQFNASTISKVCRGKQKQHKGYIFEWAD